MIRLYQAGQIHLDELITNRYPLEEVNRGYDDLLEGRRLGLGRCGDGRWSGRGRRGSRGRGSRRIVGARRSRRGEPDARDRRGAHPP